jgi:hypothetical protein
VPVAPSGLLLVGRTTLATIVVALGLEHSSMGVVAGLKVSDAVPDAVEVAVAVVVEVAVVVAVAVPAQAVAAPAAAPAAVPAAVPALSFLDALMANNHKL